MQLKILTSILGFKNYLLPTQLGKLQFHQIYVCMLLPLSQVLNIFSLLFSSSLNRLNALSPIRNLYKLAMCKTLVLVLFGIAVQQRQTLHHSITVPPLKVSGYLILDIAHYLQILLKYQMNGKLNVKTINNFDHIALLSSVDK